MKKKTWYTLITLVIMGIIFFFSGQPGEESSQISGKFAQWIASIPVLGTVVTEMTEVVPLRKMAHMFSYFILAISMNLTVGEWVRTLKGFDITGLSPAKREWLIAFVAIFLCFLYACSDEFHQTFVAGRVGCMTDVGIDMIGSLVGTVVMALVRKPSIG